MFDMKHKGEPIDLLREEVGGIGQLLPTPGKR